MEEGEGEKKGGGGGGKKKGGGAKGVGATLGKDFQNLQREGEEEVAVQEEKFNETVAAEGVQTETVARISGGSKGADEPPRAGAEAEGGDARAGAENKGEAGAEKKGAGAGAGGGEEDVAKLIDSQNNKYVITQAGTGLDQMELTIDQTLIKDLVNVVVLAALGGVAASLLGLPSMLGYLVSGCVAGPGMLGLVEELVQVETVAQFGVIFMLFELGLHFSVDQVTKVGRNAILGGVSHIALLAAVGGAIGGQFSFGAPRGMFVACVISMSSTAIVSKCLVDSNLAAATSGQLMIGILIVQDCLLGFLLAILPAAARDPDAVIGNLGFRSLQLGGFFLVAYIFRTRLVLRLLSVLSRLTPRAPDIFKLAIIALCLSFALTARWLEISTEVGAFIAGLMFCDAPHTKKVQSEISGIVHFFSAIFMSSIGLIMHPHFLLEHGRILMTCVVAVFVAKFVVGAACTRACGYTTQLSAFVAFSLAHVGEFGFVLLSRAKNLDVIDKQWYLLLLGTTAISLLCTPFLWKIALRITTLSGGNMRSPPQKRIFSVHSIGSNALRDL